MVITSAENVALNLTDSTRDRWRKGFGLESCQIQDFVWLGYGLDLRDAATESFRSKNSFKMSISTNNFYAYFFSGRPFRGHSGNLWDRVSRIAQIDTSRESSKLGESGAPLTEKLRKTQLYSSYKKVRIDFSRSALLKEL